MFEKVREIISQYTETSEIEEDSSLEADLGLSSFDVISIVADFEEKFEIEISDRDIPKFVYLRDIVEYLNTRKEGA